MPQSALSPEVAAAMRKKAQEVRERQQQGSFTKTWSLSGKNSIVEQGKGVVARLAPRWDYASSMIMDPATQQRVANPAYKAGLAFVIALEHWWEQDGGGRTTREWCIRSLIEKAVCPICLAALAFKASGSKDDRDYGKRIEAREVFIFNAVVGNPRRMEESGGLVDIRPISLSGTIFNRVSDIMTGGDNEAFARGDITNPRDGYDLVLKRPVKGGGERWVVDVAPEPSPLYSPAQAAAFKGWVGRLLNLEEMLVAETKTAVALFKAFYGRDPNAEELAQLGAEAEAPTEPDTQQAADEPAADATAEPPMSPDDEFMMPPTASTQKPAATAKPTAPAARAPRR